jgi:hypothetical protein
MGKNKRKSSQPNPESVMPLLAPIQALQNLLLKYHNRGVIIGGVAASLLGSPRYTVDLDAVFLIDFDDLPRFILEAADQGIEPRISDPIAFARKSRMVLLRHTSSSTDIDISMGLLPFEVDMVQRSQEISLGPLRLRLPTPEDLVIMKAVAHRKKDLDDIQSIVSSHPHLDRERIQYWVNQFGEALDSPGLWKEIEALF